LGADSISMRSRSFVIFVASNGLEGVMDSRLRGNDGLVRIIN
jgi:hypothetical protein